MLHSLVLRRPVSHVVSAEYCRCSHNYINYQKQPEHILPHDDALAAAVVLDLAYGELLEVEK